MGGKWGLEIQAKLPTDIPTVNRVWRPGEEATSLRKKPPDFSQLFGR